LYIGKKIGNDPFSNEYGAMTMERIPAVLMRIGIFLILCCSAAQAQTLPEEAGKSDSTKYTIADCINTLSMDKNERTDAGYQYWFADKSFADGKTLKLSVVRSHLATHPPHSHPEDEFFFVLEGKAEFFLDGKWTAVGPNTSLYCPSNVEHGIRNAGDTELKYLVIKKYEK
jgi:mannose-6-phosphate isomerase-like protein (cupin superfamily)